VNGIGSKHRRSGAGGAQPGKERNRKCTGIRHFSTRGKNFESTQNRNMTTENNGSTTKELGPRGLGVRGEQSGNAASTEQGKESPL